MPRRIFGMTPLVAIVVGWVAWRWWNNQSIIPRLSGMGMDVEGLGDVNAFPQFSGINAFPTLGEISADVGGSLGAAAPRGSHVAAPLARRLMVRSLPYSRLR